ncbi:MAG: hypothetical protein V1913_02355 [Fibrobacterota bacterium]
MSKLTLTLIAATVSLFAAAQTFAEEPVPTAVPGTTSSQGAGFVDNDNDGICDNHGTANQGQGQGKGQGKGCKGTGCGKSFTDANKDGVCDNAANRQAGKGQGKGKSQGKGKNP